MSIVVREDPRSVHLELSTRALAARTSLILLAGIWIAFCGLWITLVLAKAPDGGTVEVADRPGPGRLARPLLRLETPTGDRWLGEGYARVELERAAAVLQEGVRTARASLAVVGTPPLA